VTPDGELETQDESMKENKMPRFIGHGLIALALACFAMMLPLTARADDASAKLYQGKCVACHAADGTGNTPGGKALKVTSFSDPDVQKQSDADLTTIIAKGKNKMPAYEKSLKPEEIKGLVAYVRELGKK
jgi:mono/diheme cytochrome c family protein